MRAMVVVALEAGTCVRFQGLPAWLGLLVGWVQVVSGTWRGGVPALAVDVAGSVLASPRWEVLRKT